MGTIRREDANHILRNLMARIHWISRTHCLHCDGPAFKEIEEALAVAETDIKALKDFINQQNQGG